MTPICTSSKSNCENQSVPSGGHLEHVWESGTFKRSPLELIRNFEEPALNCKESSRALMVLISMVKSLPGIPYSYLVGCQLLEN